MFNITTHTMTADQLKVIKHAIEMKIDVLQDTDGDRDEYVEIMTLLGVCNSAIACCETLSRSDYEYMYDMPITDLLYAALVVCKEVLHDQVIEKMEANTCSVDNVNELVIITDLVARLEAFF